MKQERMKVLEMLEAGRITAEEATKLLEAMKGSGQEREIHTFTLNEDTEKQVAEKLNRFTQGVDNFAREFGSKVDVLYKEFEPKVKKAGQTVLEKTAAVFDEISKSLNESLENARKSADCKDECPEGEAKTEDCNCSCSCECECEDESPKEN